MEICLLFRQGKKGVGFSFYDFNALSAYLFLDTIIMKKNV